MAISRAELKRPVLQKEAVQVDELGGEVIVRALMLDEHLELHAKRKGDGEEGASGARVVHRTLALAVLANDGEPLMSEEDWRVFGGEHLSVALRLYNRISHLSGSAAGVAEKN